MITYVKGDIFTSPAKIIVNAVNTVGVMGKGIALEFKNRYPEMFDSYKGICEEKKFDVGDLVLWKGASKWVLLFPTKRHWRKPSKLEYIEQGLIKFVECWDKLGANSIAFPKLGCGSGGLEWDAVRPLMEKYLKPLPIQIFVYEKDSGTEQKNIVSIPSCKESTVTGYEKFRLQLKKYMENSESISELTDSGELEEKDGILYFNGDVLEEQEICKVWNWIRDVGVFRTKEIPEEFGSTANVVLNILHRMNYISEVIVSEDGIDFPVDANGYQYIAG